MQNVNRLLLLSLATLATLVSGCGLAPSTALNPDLNVSLTDKIWRLESLDTQLQTTLFQSTVYTQDELDEFNNRGIDISKMNPSEIGKSLSAHTYAEPTYSIAKSYVDYKNSANSTQSTTSKWYFMEMKFLSSGKLEGSTYDDANNPCSARILRSSEWGWKDSNLTLLTLDGLLFDFDSEAQIKNYTVNFENGKLVLTAHTGDQPGLTGGYHEATVRAVFRSVPEWRCVNGQPVKPAGGAAPTNMGSSYNVGEDVRREPTYIPEPAPTLERKSNLKISAAFTKTWDKQSGVLRLDASASTPGYKYQWFFGWLAGAAQSPAATENPQMVLMVRENQLTGSSPTARWVVLNLVDDSGKVYASDRQMLE